MNGDIITHSYLVKERETAKAVPLFVEMMFFNFHPIKLQHSISPENMETLKIYFKHKTMQFFLFFNILMHDHPFFHHTRQKALFSLSECLFLRI